MTIRPIYLSVSGVGFSSIYYVQSARRSGKTLAGRGDGDPRPLLPTMLTAIAAATPCKDEQPLLNSAEFGRAVVRTRRSLLHRLVHCAAGLALLFIGSVLSFSTCLCTVTDVLSSVLSSGALDAPPSRLPSNQTCFSRAAAEGDQWQPLARSFRYKGEVRQSPLPRRTRYRQQPKAADWPARDVPRERALWYIRGEAYDLREFVALHPGGRRYLQNTVGSDVTELFEARHNRHPDPEPEPEPLTVSPKPPP